MLRVERPLSPQTLRRRAWPRRSGRTGQWMLWFRTRRMLVLPRYWWVDRIPRRIPPVCFAVGQTNLSIGVGKWRVGRTLRWPRRADQRPKLRPPNSIRNRLIRCWSLRRDRWFVAAAAQLRMAWLLVVQTCRRPRWMLPWWRRSRRILRPQWRLPELRRQKACWRRKVRRRRRWRWLRRSRCRAWRRRPSWWPPRLRSRQWWLGRTTAWPAGPRKGRLRFALGIRRGLPVGPMEPSGLEPLRKGRRRRQAARRPPAGLSCWPSSLQIGALQWTWIRTPSCR